MEPKQGPARPLLMTHLLRLSLVALIGSTMSACLSQESDSGGGSDCVSRYRMVAESDDWPGLKQAMLANTDFGRVHSLRTQARGADARIEGRGHEVVRVMDLLNHQGRRLIQVDIWRSGTDWRAGAWSQCID